MKIPLKLKPDLRKAALRILKLYGTPTDKRNKKPRTIKKS